jgi:hypothetical protein
MASVTYTALRRIISGHSASTSYSIDFEASRIDPALNFTRDFGISLDGTTEGILSRVEDTWAVTTSFIDSTDLSQWKEFLASVAAAEGFTFDAYGTSGSPDNPETVILTGQPTIQRVTTTLIYQVTFNVRVI